MSWVCAGTHKAVYAPAFTSSWAPSEAFFDAHLEWLKYKKTNLPDSSPKLKAVQFLGPSTGKQTSFIPH